MDNLPIFSQVPSIVLKKHTPKHNQHRVQKRVTISEPPKQERKTELSASEFEEVEEKPQELPDTRTSDAVVQTESVRLIDRGTQTDASLFDYDKYCALLEERSLTSSVFKPVQLNHHGCPPLKIGLSLRGKKRKVFYPTEGE